MNRRRRRLRLLAGVVLAAAFLYLAFGRLDAAPFLASLRAVAIPPLLAALVFLAAGYMARIWRWWLMLRAFDRELPLHNCAGPLLASIAINNVLPFRAGDLVRVIAFRDRLNAPVMRLAGTLFIERLLDLVVLLAFLFAGSASVASEALPQGFFTTLRWLAVMILALLAVLVLAPGGVRRPIAGLIDTLVHNARHRERMHRWLEEFFSTLVLLKSRRTVIPLLAASVLVWSLEGAVFLAVSWALQSPLGIPGGLFATATGTLATLIPGTPGYVGTFDYFTMLAAMAYDREREWAAAFALTVHLILWVPLTVAGLSYLLLPQGKKLRETVRCHRPETTG